MPVKKPSAAMPPLTEAALRCVRLLREAWDVLRNNHEEVVKRSHYRVQGTTKPVAVEDRIWYSADAVPKVKELLKAILDYREADEDDLHVQIAARYGAGRQFPTGDIPLNKAGWTVYGGTVGRLPDWHAYAAYAAWTLADQCKAVKRKSRGAVEYHPLENYETFFNQMPRDIEADLVHEGAALVEKDTRDLAELLKGWVSADYLHCTLGIPRSRLSEAATAGNIRTKPAPQGTLDTQGKQVRKLYNKKDAEKHCKSKRGLGRARNRGRLT